MPIDVLGMVTLRKTENSSFPQKSTEGETRLQNAALYSRQYTRVFLSIGMSLLCNLPLAGLLLASTGSAEVSEKLLPHERLSDIGLPTPNLLMQSEKVTTRASKAHLRGRENDSSRLLSTVVTENQNLTASDGSKEDFFGDSVSVWGNIIAVGSYYDDTSAGTDAGAFHLLCFWCL